MAEFEGRGSAGLSLVGPQKDVRFYAEHAAPSQDRVLVLGCGPGNLVLGLAQAQKTVVGVDSSPRLVAQATARLAQLPEEDQARVRLLVSDPRAVRLGEKFGAVIVPHNGLSLLVSEEEMLAVLATVKHHLEPGGNLAFDVVNAPSGPRRGLGILAYRRPFTAHLRERHRSGIETDEGGIHRWKVRHLSAPELEAVLAKEGFVVTERWGGFDGHPFEAEDAVQVVVAAYEGKR